jgi:hypothetical protein
MMTDSELERENAELNQLINKFKQGWAADLQVMIALLEEYVAGMSRIIKAARECRAGLGFDDSDGRIQLKVKPNPEKT